MKNTGWARRRPALLSVAFRCDIVAAIDQKGSDMSELLRLQFRFSRMVGELIREAITQGFQITLGEALRSPAQAALNQKTGAGIAHSLHCDSLAIDLHLFKQGAYLDDTAAYTSLGEWWEQQGGTWGGRFGDGNHFSLSYQGRK